MGTLVENMHVDIDQKLREFIGHNFFFQDGRVSLSDSQSLLDGGIIDSGGVLQLVVFLESEFGFSVQDAEVVRENFDSIRNIANYVERKTKGRL